MSDYGRYSSSSYETRGRDRDRSRSNRSDSIFGSRWDSDRSERGYDDNRPSGWFGDGRTSDYDDRDRDSRRSRSSRQGDWAMSRREGGDRNRRDRHYGYDDYNDGLAIDETGRLIASNKVEGTPVYGRGGERLGSIYNFMVDKRSGKVEYAVMSYGGFLGMGQRYYPLPWRTLSYDTREGGYRVDLRERDLENAPSFGRQDEPDFSDDYSRRVHGWYGLNY